MDERVLEQRDSHASSSHEPSVEPMRSVDLGKHSVYTHFPKDRTCEICQRTKITRAPCGRRTGRVERRAENFGDLITADHKIVSEGCESRNNQRYAVVVQELATQWIQSYQCKTNISQEAERSLQKFLEPNRKPKVIYTDNSLESVQLVLIGCLTELIWTPRSKSNTLTPWTNSQTYWQKKEISHVMNGIINCVCSTSAISVPSIVLKRCRKEHKKMQVKKKSQQQSKPMMNLVSRHRVRDPNVLASTASESPEKTKSESQNVLLSSLNVQQTSTVRPVLGAGSSSSSGWNNDDKWSSQVWKSGEMSGTSTAGPVSNKFVIDDDMDSDTATESNVSLRSRSFLNRVDDRLRKMQDRSPSDAMQDIDKCSLIWRMFLSSTLEASAFMGKNYSDNLRSIDVQGKISL